MAGSGIFLTRAEPRMPLARVTVRGDDMAWSYVEG